jgi:AcrR family transcriptional regulator
MAPPRKHDTDVILDTARALVLVNGPRAVSVTAIASASGAPAGTLYHRFGNRNGVLTRTWLRSLERFQDQAMAATGRSALEAAVAMALTVVTFARVYPQDAQLLLTIRPEDLVDGEPNAAFYDTLKAMNAPLIARMNGYAEQLYGDSNPRTVDAMARAVVDLPYGAVRRHAFDDPLPRWLEDDVASAARALLKAFVVQ